MNFVNISMEAIGFQSPDVADKLKKFVSEIMSERSGKAADASKARKDMLKYLKDTTGMKLNIVFDTDLPPCTLPFHINPDTILGYSSIKDFYVEESNATMKRLLAVKERSFVDLKNAKVGGIFSEFETPIYMNFQFLRSLRFSIDEIVAIMAHEIGHDFVAYEMAFRTARTNQVLSACAKASAGGDQGVYEYVLKSSEDVLDLKSGVFDELKQVRDQKTVLTVVIGAAQRKTHEESVAGNTAYDVTTFEALADNFAARLGLGKALVTGLEKLHRAFGSSEFDASGRIAVTICDIASVMVVVGAGAVLAMGGLVGGFYLGIMALLLYMRLDGRDHNNVYDKLSIRFKRIKEQMVTYLKNTKLPANEVKQSLAAIAHVEKTISDISEYKGFLVPIFNMIDPASRALNSARDVQSNLEAIVANDMYIKAAALRTL